MTTIQPTFDHIVIEAIVPPTKSKGGIYLPDIAKKNEFENRVVAVGPGKRGFNDQLLPMPCEVGDIVLAHRNNGTEIKLDDKIYRIIGSDSVMAVITTNGA